MITIPERQARRIDPVTRRSVPGESSCRTRPADARWLCRAQRRRRRRRIHGRSSPTADLRLVAPMAANIPSCRMRRGRRPRRPLRRRATPAEGHGVERDHGEGDAAPLRTRARVGQRRDAIIGHPELVDRPGAPPSSSPWPAIEQRHRRRSHDRGRRSARTNSSPKSAGFSTEPTTVRCPPPTERSPPTSHAESRSGSVGDGHLVVLVGYRPSREGRSSVRPAARSDPGARTSTGRPSRAPARTCGRSPREARTARSAHRRRRRWRRLVLERTIRWSARPRLASLVKSACCKRRR